MSLHRYLLYFSYIGKNFRGAQRQGKRDALVRIDDETTVQGRLEMGLKQLNPCNEPIAVLSSRTDAGVHALSSTCHVDLQRKNDLIYDPKVVTICLNQYFKKTEIPIRVQRTFLVPEDFHCRHRAISRTYLYRLLVAKSETLHSAPNFYFVPMEEWDRLLFYCTSTFNIEAMKEAAKLFEGWHDFRTFMGQQFGQEKQDTKRNIYKMEVVQRPLSGYSSYSWPSIAPPFDQYKQIDVYIQAKGFLYKQVRRTVGTLIAAAQGKVTVRDIKCMLEVPSVNSWLPQIKSVPAHGLYLCQVQYSEEDFHNFRHCLVNNC